MRDIKFRAWDKARKDWVPGGYGFHILGEAMLIGGLFQDMPIEKLKDIEVMQFTGLKDRNGKEIYEGDIVRGVIEYGDEFTGEGTGEKETRTEIVNFEDGMTGFPAFMAGSINYGEFPLEVIGNIWENPELTNIADPELLRE